MQTLRTPRRRLLSTIALSACALLSVAGLAKADNPDDWSLGWGAGSWDGMEFYQGPSLVMATTQLDRIADVLGLDEAQREEMMSLFEALEDEHLTAWVAFAERNGDLQNKGMTGKDDWAEIQEQQGKIADEFEAEQDRLVDLMLSDLELLVTPEQAERWGTLDRERRRMDTLTAYGCYPAERYDLVEVVKTMDDDNPERFDEIIERYAAELDPLLQARNRALENASEAFADYNEKQRTMWSGFDWSDPSAASRYEEIEAEVQSLSRAAVSAALSARPACKRVADFNERFASEIRALLDKRAQREFDELISTESAGADNAFDFTNYSRARRMFTTVLNLEDMLGAYRSWSDSMGGGEWGIMRIAREMEPLTPKQISTIEEIQDRFEAEMEIVDARRPGGDREEIDTSAWTFTLRTAEGNMTLNHNDPPEAMGKGGAQMIASGKGGVFFGDNGEMTEEMQEWQAERARVEQRFIAEIREELTLRQRALLAIQ